MSMIKLLGSRIDMMVVDAEMKGSRHEAMLKVEKCIFVHKMYIYATAVRRVAVRLSFRWNIEFLEAVG